MKVLAIILAVVIGFRLLVRYLLPLLGKFAIKKVTKNMQEQSKRQTQGDKVYEKGDVEIRKPNQRSSNQNDIDDEYVDYTEVKE